MLIAHMLQLSTYRKKLQIKCILTTATTTTTQRQRQQQQQQLQQQQQQQPASVVQFACILTSEYVRQSGDVS